MTKKATLFLTIMAIMIFGVYSLSAGQFIPNAPFKAELMKAPDFALKDLKNKTFKLSKNFGKPILLFFGTSWCPACRSEIPAMKNIYATYSPKGLKVIYINIGESTKRVERFVQINSLPYRVLLDKKETVADQYNIIGVPTFILIDKDSIISNISHRTVDLPLEKLFTDKKQKKGTLKK